MASPTQFATHSDAELLRLALQGDEGAFLSLYQRLKNGIFRYAFYMIGCQASAEDITQEVFISLLREGGTYRADLGDVGAFAFGIARNLVRRAGRRQRSHPALPYDRPFETLSAALVSDSEALPGRMIRDQVVEQVRDAIASLPDHYRQVVVLCDLCELSYKDAAARLDCPVGTIRSRLNRAHTLLAQKLKPFHRSEPEFKAHGPEGCAI